MPRGIYKRHKTLGSVNTQKGAKNPFVHRDDPVNYPKHYTSNPSGIECIEVTRHMNFNKGNAIKYLWRAGLKQDASLSELDKEIQDIDKAIWYANDEKSRLRKIKDGMVKSGNK